MASSFELTTLGHRIRHHRLARGYTLDELGALVGVAGSQLSLIENGKREPKLSLLQEIARATETEVTELLSREPPNRRAALEIELERAQTSPFFRQLGIPPVKVTKGTSDDTIEAVLGLHRELQRRERETIASPEEARRANTELRLRMREMSNHLPEIERLAEKQLKSRGSLDRRSHPPHGEHHGGTAGLRTHLRQRPAALGALGHRSRERAHLPAARVDPGGHGLRSMALQAMAHRCSDTARPPTTPTSSNSASRSTTTPRAASCPRRARSPSSPRRRRTATSLSRTSATRSG